MYTKLIHVLMYTCILVIPILHYVTIDFSHLIRHSQEEDETQTTLIVLGLTINYNLKIWFDVLLNSSREWISRYLFLVSSLVRNSNKWWFLQSTRLTVRLTCSYQLATEAPKAIGGHTSLGANLLITYCVPCTPFGTE